MRRRLYLAILSVPLAIAGLVLGQTLTKQPPKTPQNTKAGYICPITGEELPCPNCCPLNKKK